MRTRYYVTATSTSVEIRKVFGIRGWHVQMKFNVHPISAIGNVYQVKVQMQFPFKLNWFQQFSKFSTTTVHPSSHTGCTRDRQWQIWSQKVQPRFRYVQFPKCLMSHSPLKMQTTNNCGFALNFRHIFGHNCMIQFRSSAPHSNFTPSSNSLPIFHAESTHFDSHFYSKK